MDLFKRKPEPEEALTIVLQAETEDDLERLRIVIARATKMLAQAEPTNRDAEVVYAAFRSYLPVPVRPRAANVLQFPGRAQP